MRYPTDKARYTLLTPAKVSLHGDAVFGYRLEHSVRIAVKILNAISIVESFFKGHLVFVLHGETILCHAAAKIKN